MKPLAEITVAVEANPSLRKSLGRGAMWEACAGCVLAGCDSTSSACKARQLRTQQQRAQYAARRSRRRRQARKGYRKHRDARRAYSKAYQRDPQNLAALAIKRRLRYAAKRGGQVRPYQWKNPLRNKGSQHTTRAT